jgi:membrane peptidoglycan carboxypeptidase
MIDGTEISNDPTDEQYAGMVPIDFAMKVSLNTVFDGLALAVGPENVAATAHAAGIPTTCGDNAVKTLQNASGQTTFGIGIGDYPVPVIGQAAGYATLAAGGVQHGSYFVQKATDSKGTVVYTHKDVAKQAMDPKVANDVTLTLQPIASFSGYSLAGGRVAASKTGTEGIASANLNGNSDAWTVGYTPQVSAAVWVGSGDATQAILAANGRAEYGRDLPGKTWKAFMDAYLAGQPNMPMASRQQVFLAGRAAPTYEPPSTSSAPTTSAPASTTAAQPTPTPTLTPTTSAPPATTSAPPSTSASSTPTPPGLTCTPPLPAHPICTPAAAP